MLRVPRQYKDKEILYRRIILFTAFLVMIILYFEKIMGVCTYILSICMPFLFGGGLAFIFNQIANGLMRYSIRFFNIKETNLTRIMVNISAIVIVFTIFLSFMFIIFPQLFTSFERIVNNLPEALNTFYLWAYRNSTSFPALHNWIVDMNISFMDFDNITSWLNEIAGWVFSGGANNIFGSVFQVISTTFSIVLSTLVSIMFSIILLFNKKTIIKEGNGLMKAYLNEDIYQQTIHTLKLVNKTFSAYIGGTCMECIILGTLVTLGATLFNIPYALLAGITVGIGALVPMFGALIASILAALFIATASVDSAIYFMIMFICIQQVEGNFIYPNVVGRSVGFPPIYVIIAVTVGASFAGILGMVIFIPICSCIYQLVKEDVILRLKGKRVLNK